MLSMQILYHYLHLTEEKFLRLREIKKLTQDHTAIKKQSWDVNSTIAASRVELLNLSTTDIWNRIILCIVVGACPGHQDVQQHLWLPHIRCQQYLFLNKLQQLKQGSPDIVRFSLGNKISPKLEHCPKTPVLTAVLFCLPFNLGQDHLPEWSQCSFASPCMLWAQPLVSSHFT